MREEITGLDAAESNLHGMRVLILESRRAVEMARLIENYGGAVLSAPSMRELPAGSNAEALRFAGELLAGKFRVVIFLTGVGARMLIEAMATQHPSESIVSALSRAITVARGPKPAGVLREYGIPVMIAVPEPNTWRDVLKAMDDYRPGIFVPHVRIAVQEYGVSNPEFLQELQQRGAEVTRVPVYQWALPEDLEPLRTAVRAIAAGRVDVLLVTSATQVDHLMRVAAQEGMEDSVRQGLRNVVIGSIGPIASAGLQRHGLPADFEPTHPKMGQLVFEAAQHARTLLARKKQG